MDDFEWLKDKVEKLAGQKEEIARLYDLVEEKLYVKGNWAFKKLIILSYYIDIFTNVLQNSETNVVYIDLLAGPGFNYMKDIDLIIAGSPLIAQIAPRILRSGTSKKFNSMLLVETDDGKCRSLSRILPDAEIICTDCNSPEVLQAIDRHLKPRDSFFLAFIDPEGTEAHWNTLQYLASRRGDFVINYPYSGIGRLYGGFQGSSGNERKAKGTRLDNFFGTDEWRTVDCSQRIKSPLYDFYLKRLGVFRQRIIDFDIPGGGYKILVAARQTRTGSPWMNPLEGLKRRIESITDDELEKLVAIYKGDQEQLTKYLG
ncbi:MAG: three-Cys-motif partner protein TcmP [Candidatus Thorarchaeota archaeon]